ncbi:ATP12 family protein [Phenylobacterium sp.]|uniref:ATP12 family chaperone protein n=1 Tax=Phenylobacterium sp. TaxID=1871053 RepID=UPI00344661AF
MDLRKGFHEPAEKPKRFYKAVTVAEAEGGGFGVLLDGRNLRTPRAERLVLPTPAAAGQIAEEWAAQTDVIEMATMHATRLANTAIETIGATREGVADQIAQYAGSDLLCYFAESPVELVRRQEAAWGPILARAEAEDGLAFERCEGILHQAQPPETLARVREIALGLDDFQLAGLAFGAALFGSAVLALALLRGWTSGEGAFELSRLDEAFQEEKWGIDEEAAERTARLTGEAAMLERWFRALEA